MINAKDLRIGNFVTMTCDDKTFDTKIDVGDFMDINRKYKIVQGIPLTEEILLKCGFKGTLFSNYFTLDKWFELKLEDSVFHYDLFRSQVVEIKYLHQIQNLYFALMGQELEINL